MIRPGVRPIMLVTIALALLLGAPSGAFATEELPDGGDGSHGPETKKVVGTCVLYANEVSMGADCISGDGPSSKVDLEVLFAGKDKVCRYDPLQSTDPAPDEPLKDGHIWWVERCVERDPSGPDKGKIRYTYDIIQWVCCGAPSVLTEAQELVWIYASAAYPLPILKTSPERPRVWTDTGFLLTDTSALITRDPQFERTRRVYAGPTMGDVTMTARVVKTTFTVEDPDGKPVPLESEAGWQCSRTFAVLAEDVCTAKFLRSTAIYGDDGVHESNEKPDKYYVNTAVLWEVSYTTQYAGGGTLGQFEIELGRYLRVSEIQTLNR